MNINWHNIDLVMFDMDGTLLDLAFDNHFWQHAVPEAWADANQHSHDDAKHMLYPQFKQQEGSLNWYSLPYWSNALSLDLTQLKQQYQAHIQLRPHATDLLQQLQQAGKTLWLVTNAHPIVLDIKLQKTGIAPYFKHIISSHDLGYAKEQAQFWQHLEQRYPFKKQHSIFVDDSEPVLKAAQQYGIAHTFGIRQPDSTQGDKHIEHVHSLHHLTDLTRELR